MKLLLVQAGFGAGGAEKIAAMIAAHRISAGDEVHVAGMATEDSGSYFAYPECAHLHMIQPLKISRRLTQARRYLHIRKIIRAVRPDLIISFLTKVNVLTMLAARGTGVPVVISERNNPLVQSGNPMWLKAVNRLARGASGIVMQTERARLDLPADLIPKASVIPNPCAPLGGIHIGSGQTRLVAVGRLDRQKGFDMLLRAMPEVLRNNPDIRLTIFGEGPERGALEQQISAANLSDIVSLPGASPKPGDWMQDADILVFPSRFEGFPNVVAEATVTGLPVISFDCAYGPRELIRDRGNGLLVPAEDVAGLTKAIVSLSKDDALLHKMRQNARHNREWLEPQHVLSDWDSLIANVQIGVAAKAGTAKGLTELL
ncbi:glycosyltransferase family 4 protein [Ruegeria faecimaris]|uniref:glycosyltransferase family 4 protein n=1 Tax=Ruegeria faecimaris TaxID=686389 RepID=UPI00232D1C42|nr:glycosyltransferase family 4 protein [Ruegeria faecimaris]